MKILHDQKEGEVFFTDNAVFVVEDLNEQTSVRKIRLYSDGSFGDEKLVSWDTYLAERNHSKAHVKEKTFEDLKNLFQGDLKIFLN